MRAHGLKEIMIGGGGTAGWMSAAALLHSLGKHYRIQLDLLRSPRLAS